MGSEAYKPVRKASDVFSVWSSPQKWDHKTFLVSSEAYKPEVKASDVFLCGLHPKNGILCAVFTLK